ncbi:MAG: pyridoxamine 5'-phosphate oxidase family protein [Chitinophagaceae bacterium]
MDSINKQQAEENHKDLQGSEAAKKIQELVGEAKSCFFCTDLNSGGQFTTRPMAVQKVDDSGTLWFLSADDSHKNAEIHTDSYVQLLFQGSDYAEFLSIYGKATITKDKDKIKDLWKPTLKTWFTEGVDDPRISVIAVAPQDGYYWDNKHGAVVAFAKQLVGAAMGKTLDDSIEGNISL